MTRIFIGLAGIAAILSLAFLLSTDRRAIRLRVVAAAFALQAAIAGLVLYFPPGKWVIEEMARGVTALLGYAGAGTRAVFGGIATDPTFGNTFALAALPVIIFFAALVSVLYHLGVMQWLVRWIGGGIEWVTGVSRVESLYAAANIFVGQSEAPLVIRPYLAALTQAQLFAVMTIGMAGVAGTILAAYAAMLGPGSLPHLLAASFMAAPGGLLMAKIIVPDPAGAPPEEEVLHAAETAVEEKRAANVIMAAADGAQTGVRIAVAVAAMIIAFVALVALANGLLGAVGGWVRLPGLSFQSILGAALAPVMYLLNIPWNEASAAGGLVGTKVVLNEFVAFAELGQAKGLSPHTVGVVTFALCGFANFSSIAIQMAVIGGLAPGQRPVVARLGLRALAAGSLSNLLSAAMAGLLLA